MGIFKQSTGTKKFEEQNYKEGDAFQRYGPPASRAKPCPRGENGWKRPVPVTDSATFTTPEAGDEDLGDLLLEVLPPDGSTIGTCQHGRH